MDQTYPLLFAFFFCLSGYAVTAAAVIEGATSQEAFVFNGLRTLAVAPVRKSTPSSNQESIQYRDVTECKVYCNGKRMKKSVCVGRTEVNCLTFTEGDDSSGNQVEVYERTCEGRFVNDTTTEDDCLDTTQACHGLTTLTMRLEHKEPENAIWVTDMVFEKQCAPHFIMDVTECEDPKGKKLGRTRVVTLCDGSAFTAIDNKVPSAPSTLLEPAKPSHGETAIVQCNGKPSEWTRTCRGLFEATEDDKVARRSTICDGKWTSFGVNFECRGEYLFSREEAVTKGYDNLERGCSGSALISSANHDKVYQFCSGESKFNEIFTVPPVPATT